MGKCLGSDPLLARDAVVTPPSVYTSTRNGNEQLYYHCSVFALEIFLEGSITGSATRNGRRVSLFRTGDNGVADVDDRRKYFNRPDQYNPGNHILDQKCIVRCAFVFENALAPDEFTPGIEYRHHGNLAFDTNPHFIGFYVRNGDLESLVRLLRVLHILNQDNLLVAYGDLNFAAASAFTVDRSPADALRQAFPLVVQPPRNFFRDPLRKGALIAALR